MKLILLHPGVAAIRCDDCARWVHDMTTGSRNTYEVRDGERLPVPRSGPPPCRLGWQCPKESPEKARQHELTGRNRRMLEAFWRHRAAPGPPADIVAAEAYSLLEGMFRAYERAETSVTLAKILYPRLKVGL